MKGMHDPQFGATLHTTLSALSGQVSQRVRKLQAMTQLPRCAT